MGSTPLGFPYPEGTDRVMDGDNAIRALAEAVDAEFGGGGGSAAGKVSATATSAASVTVSVTFPAGRFSAAPIMAATATNSYWIASSHPTPTATGVTLYARQYEATAGSVTFDIHWIARAAG